MKKYRWLLALVALLVAFLIAWLFTDGTTPTTEPATTAAPATTTAPVTTTAPATTTAPVTTTAPETTNAPETTSAPTTVPVTEPSTQPPETTCGHQMSDWQITAATCETDGAKTRSCVHCGHAEMESIAPTGHTWNEGKATTTPTSCSDMGIKTYTCQTCGKIKTEQIQGNHPFGEWEYEEYTYEAYSASGRLKTYTSHRKVRICSKCGYKETAGTPDHSCKIGANCHTEKVIEAATCTQEALVRSTCTICGWYTDYRTGGTCDHSNKSETRHLTDYGAYTNELDARVSECTACGKTSTTFIYGEGWSDYNRYSVKLTFAQGNAETLSIENPTHQMVSRDFVYDSDGYVKQFTFYWWYNGQRYSQVIKCDKASMIAWFAEYGLDTNGSESYIVKPDGRHIVPYKITWAG